MRGQRHSLGAWFSELGRPAEALPVTQEAVTIRRELDAPSPDRYRPDLAASLSNLGIRYSQLGRQAGRGQRTTSRANAACGRSDDRAGLGERS